MSNKDLSKKPHHPKGEPSWWWYEEPKGIYVIIQCSNNDTHTRIIPWRALRAALRRKEKAP